MAYRPGPNDLLRAARLALRSPSGSGRPMSRQELAEAVNAYLYDHAGRMVAVAGHYIGNLERGQTRWPSAHYRQALRAVLGRATDTELGFFIIKGHASDADTPPTELAPPTGASDTATTGSSPGVPPGVATLSEGALDGAGEGLPVASAGAAAVVQVSVNAGATITVVCHGGPPVCVAVVAGPVELLVEPVVSGPAYRAPAPASWPSVDGGARVYSLAARRAR
ncbi:hypothetical protein ACIG87_28590 [Micromonospora sp. NPDC051925]|uniref:hypothetical protein n=1 Tax=Micromonospora sp. NPDC051925 TaxID=3364288 RepID=UPI0037CB8E5F